MTRTIQIADRIARVEERFGGREKLQSALPTVLTEKQLAARSDAEYLSALTRRIFRAGLKHSLVDRKWPAFETAFFDFAPEKMVLLSDRDLDQRMQNRDLIRHWGKMSAIPVNAQMILDLAREHGSFGRFLAAWPVDDITGLWKLLAKQGKQLGGHSAPRFLRMVGKETFLFTDDVVKALIQMGLAEKLPTSLRDLKTVQSAFNVWKQESGYNLAELSQIIALSQG